ncbi:MAG: alanine--glyoxylate aminotransferase family protein [candidate division WOR-3 bacterium]|nr:alanine--glyoxylate aminotransferase family protein [candidate division WOR-3 bacterium]MCX7837310.1 alanine--glyoxylate aminotransferase family protein [candidate division WOR-3 bacterium]MDW8114678.1 alanine--glyoxylate aminotransferase family protein [candidate division WOR-3 bacterium]
MKKYLLLTVGPVYVPKNLLKRASDDLIYHREEKFHDLFSSIISQLQKILFTKNKIFIFTASGTGAMEAAVSNLSPKIGKALVVSCGYFGERWREILRSFGYYVEILKSEPGKGVALEEVERKIKLDDTIKYIFTTLTDTSTGVKQDIKNFGRIARENNRFLIVDGICGIGADEFYFDEFYCDILCGASQKALGGIPGISFLCVNERAWEIIKKSNTPRYYFDLLNYEKFLNKKETPFTPAINTLYVFDNCLKKINKIGIKKYWKRHEDNANFVRKVLLKNNLELFSQFPSNALTIIKMKEGVDSSEIIREIKEKKGILFSNGQRELKGKIIRFSHMGFIDKKILEKATKVLIREIKKYEKKV